MSKKTIPSNIYDIAGEYSHAVTNSFNPPHKARSGLSVQLNLLIDSELKREFKTFAAKRDMKQNELFEICFNYYKAHH